MSSPWRGELERGLRKFSGRRLAIVGVGNPLRSDDGVGSLLARRLAKRGLERVFDGGSAPENYAELVAASMPEVVIVVDAVCFGGEPGEARIVGLEEILGGAISTHDPSLEILSSYLRGRCGCEIRVIGVEPASRGLGMSLSSEVKETIAELETILINLENTLKG